MAKQGKATAVPRLRFPKFRKAGNWKRARLGKLFSERQEAGFTDLPLLSLMDKDGIVPQAESNRKNNSNADKSKYLRVVPGDIAYNTMRMWEGRSAYAGIDGLISPAYTVCAPTGGANSRFFSYYFKTAPLVGQFRKYSQGLVKDTLNLKYENFQRIEVAYPSDEDEQKKIADCLTSLDEVIAAQGRKVEALKAHKRGLMQQLFPRKGETRPRLRFPEFRNAPEWEQRGLGELAKRGSGHTPSKSNPAYYSEGIKWVSLADSKRLDSGFISETTIEISEQGIANSSAVLHQAGSVILCRDAGVGKSAVMKEPMAVSQHFMVWSCDAKLLSNWYLYYLFQLMKPLFEDVASGSTIKTIGLPFFKELSVIVPSLAEQQRIADCLSSLDAKITAESHQLAALKTHKQGLMQQLFPAPEAASA
ncbi:MULTISPECIES: restriction endonuclease subunit S [Rhodanobacter]|uniref:restriction endonuclease subunit S n=1 Tax=Rhodanobacter TaxID=75309 RepID=UPI000AE980E2|nr:MULTISPECIES: restriction endonuclease subunit S [Rhodanobacter]UJJ52174.1 restriction endonuclease subunit S [Rhodanobacter denitrificans]UJM94921.1 restriction endonuclease subunit S [Rhodanobacter denitrificans]UJM98451.1 restriction endonuclease subunit S [Rhodanobacter denitrificans]UJN22136.1 restriction endonuclease subunit S [Rhodanobacter denitrificans]